MDVFRVQFFRFACRNLSIPQGQGQIYLDCNFDSFKTFQTEVVSSPHEIHNPEFHFQPSFRYSTSWGINRLAEKSFTVEVRNALYNDEVIGQTKIDLETLASGPTQYELPLGGNASLYFELEMEHCTDVEVHFSDISVTLPSPPANKCLLSYRVISATARSDSFKSSKVRQNGGRFDFGTPPYIHHVLTLKELFFGKIHINLCIPKTFGSDVVAASVDIPIIEYLSLQDEQQIPFSAEVSTQACRGQLSGVLNFKNAPQFTPMHGGCYTPLGLNGARPLLASIRCPRFRAGMGPPFSTLKSSQRLRRQQGQIATSSVVLAGGYPSFGALDMQASAVGIDDGQSISSNVRNPSSSVQHGFLSSAHMTGIPAESNFVNPYSAHVENKFPSRTDSSQMSPDSIGSSENFDVPSRSDSNVSVDSSVALPSYNDLYPEQAQSDTEQVWMKDYSISERTLTESFSVARNEADGSLSLFYCSESGQPWTIQGDTALNSISEGVYYFEIFIEYAEDHENGTLSFGFAKEGFATDGLLGYDEFSFAYNGLNGFVYHAGKEKNYGPLFGSGDVIGSGFDSKTGELFFTKNGQFMGCAFINVHPDFFPTVTFLTSNMQIRANFGTSPFAFEFAQLHLGSYQIRWDQYDRIYFADMPNQKTTWNDPRTPFPEWRYTLHNNHYMVSTLKQQNRFQREKIEDALQIIPRGAFFEDKYQNLAYLDQLVEIPSPNIQILPPWLVAMVLEQLTLGDFRPVDDRRGWSVLCVGSGCGWFTALAAYLVGPNGVSRGCDVDPDVVSYASNRIDEYVSQTGRFIGNASFTCRNMLLPRTSLDSFMYDRIWVTGAVKEEFYPLFIEYLKDNGVLIIPILSSSSNQKSNLVRIVKDPSVPGGISETHLMDLSCPPLLEPTEGQLESYRQMQRFEELLQLGFASDVASFAVEHYGSDRDKMYDFLDAYKQLAELGFPTEDCAAALQKADLNVETAAALITDGFDD